MRTISFLFLTGLFLIWNIGCTDSMKPVSKSLQKQMHTDNISFHWQLDSIDLENSKSFISVEVINNGGDTLQDNWAIYYNQLHMSIDQVSDGVNINRLNGGFIEVTPSAEYQSIVQGESLKYTYVIKSKIFRHSDCPTGVYATIDGQNPLLIKDCQILGVNSETLRDLPQESPQTRYTDNVKYQRAELSITDMIIPSPTDITLEVGAALELGSGIVVSAESELTNEVNWLKRLLSQSYSGRISNGKDGQIRLNLDENASKVEGAYTLNITENAVVISAGNRPGIFNGITTLSQFINVDQYAKKKASIAFPRVSIKDSPGYEYRGMMLDVSRNFHSVESVKRLLDLLAIYKLNKFHFHLGDDEGWRVEIPGLPELTEYGGVRGHTLDEAEHLQPAYGSGPFAHPDISYGSGWYSREDYISIIRYAADRHIEIIPEMDMPGHARAAILAMELRYRKYMKKGDKEEAERYLLSDPADSSRYNSAQGYGDNSFCVCTESTYDFVEKVLDEMMAMHEEAGAPLKTFHSGGDEVAYGSWHKSPICQSFIKASSESVSHSDQLQAYFTFRYKQIIESRGLAVAGWEEYVLKNSSEGHNGKELNPKFFGSNMQPYVWNATWGWGREDMAYQLANAGYKTVMCNSAQLYFDMAYNMDPQENGLMWTGMVDGKNPFFLIPEDIYAMPYKRNSLGIPVDDDLFENHVRLTDVGKKNMYGIQGHLWSETLTSIERIEYYAFPKGLSLAERAWNPYPSWSELDRSSMITAMEQDWGRFSQKIGSHHFPILDHIFGGVGYRIPLPGAVVEDGLLKANTRYEGQSIRYTTDGSEPDANSTLYTTPVTLDSGVTIIRLKSFATNGRTSRESVIELEQSNNRAL